MMSNEAPVRKKSLQNPYSTALFSIGTIGLILAVLLIGGGSARGTAGMIAVTIAAALFILGAMAMIGWLMLEGLRWNGPRQ